MTIPNILTVIRILLTFLILLIGISGDLNSKILALVLFGIAAITDNLDGRIARKYNMISNFGKIADPIADKLLVLGVLTLFALNGVFSIWWVIPIFLRDIFVTGYRLLFLKKKTVVQAKMPGKVKAAIQMFVIIFIYFMLIFKDLGFPDSIIRLMVIIMYISLTGTLIVTFYSAIVDYLANVREQKK